MTSGTCINVVRCRRRHKEELEEEENGECSTSSQAPSDLTTEAINPSTRIPLPPRRKRQELRPNTTGMPPEDRGTRIMKSSVSSSSIAGLFIILCLILQPCSALPEQRCGSVELRNNPLSFRGKFTSVGDPNSVNVYNETYRVVNCTVVEGSFTISFIYNPMRNGLKKWRQEDYPRFPHLREITGSLLVFETNGLIDLNWIFPNLRVIGGDTLIQHYALVIYRNHDLETMGLNNLRVIRNGGVRIMENKLLCYTKSIDWKSLIMSPLNDVTIDDAAEWAVQETGRICATDPCEKGANATLCRGVINREGDQVQSCWGPKVCMRECKWDRIREENDRAGPGCDPHGNRCHEDCIGGCVKPNDATACYACKQLSHKGKCISKCEDHLYTLMKRRCVTKKHCLSLNPMDRTKPVQIKAFQGICSDRCPQGFEQDPNEPTTCKKCDGKCEIVCAGNFTIDTYQKAVTIRHCNVIDGDLKVEIRGNSDSGMATELSNMFANIHTITGYLFVMRSPPFLTLQVFKSLKVIKGNELYQGKYALVVLENQNLRKLFDENNNMKILNGEVQIHNNRMLCFREIRNLMTNLGKFKDMNESDQSPSSNGDKAICEDSRIEVTLRQVGADNFDLTWTAFNTTDIDHRKFLGYEVFYKVVDAPDPNMSIDDDRSACVDTWNSLFIQHFEPENETPNRTIQATLFTDQRILPDTTYAYYVATQMVHHPGAKNGISKIGFVTTLFATPDPPTAEVTGASSTSIELTWEPPHHPNGQITHYQIIWREIDVDTETAAETICESGRWLIGTKDRNPFPELTTTPEPTTTANPSLTSFIPKAEKTCSSTPGCCVCGEGVKTEQLASIAEEDAQFENAMIDQLLTNKCEEDSSSMDCILESMDNEEKADSEEEENEAPELRLRRASEVFERQRRRFYRRVHSIRSAGGRDLEQKYRALILSSARNRRAIQDASELMKEEKFIHRPRASTKYGSSTDIKDILESADDSNANETETMPTMVRPLDLGRHTKLVAAEKHEKNVTAKAGTNRYSLINLKPYTQYSISISACQNTTYEKNFCSNGIRAALRWRTLRSRDPDVDLVNNASIQVKVENYTTVFITWDPVEKSKSSGGVTGYIVKLEPTGGHHAVEQCVPAKKGWDSRVNGTVFTGIHDGIYRVHITVRNIDQLSVIPSIRWKPVILATPGFWTLERIGILITFILCLIVVIGLISYHYTKRFYGSKVKAMADFMSHNPEYCIDNLYKIDEWEIPKDTITLGVQCGEGSFGKVWVAESKVPFTSVKGITFGPCAVKQNMDDPTNPENLNYLMEANIMKNFETNFVVKLYGVVSTMNPPFVVMELMELGNLRDYLRSKRDDDVFNEMDCEYYDVIPREKFHEWAAQIADGMAYLESVKFCHRDLAARNCMINQFEICKIGDFGMARDLFYHDYYKPSGKRMMPVRWMAPESLKDGKFDSKSDAWSFGIVLYEMMTLGAQPYIGLSNDEVLNYIGMSRKVIKKPECCSPYWYKIMKMCWRYTPRERPTFAQLVHLLSQNASAEFRSLSHVINDVNAEVEALDLEDIDIFDGPADVTSDNERRHTDSIQMKEFKPSMDGVNSHSTISVTDDSSRALLESPPKRQRSLDDDYALMTHSGRTYEQNSDPEVRNYGGDGDYVERDVQIDVPTRRNTGASNSSYGTPYCLSNRGNSNERAGFGEGVRLTDAIGSGQLDDGDYIEKDPSMDTRRSTGASTNSYGIPPTNWSSKSGQNYLNNRNNQQNGRGDRLTHLPGTGHLQNTRGGPGGDYIESNGKNGSPSRNGNGPSYQTNRGSFNGRAGFNRLTEDPEHPLA